MLSCESRCSSDETEALSLGVVTPLACGCKGRERMGRELMGRASLEEQPDGTIRVTLSTAVGPATITVPRAALDDCSSAQLSADAFVEQLVQTALEP